MKKFIKPIATKEVVNQYGEIMNLVMSASGIIWVHHNDCNEDYEKLHIFIVKYILNAEEKNAIDGFIKECTKIIDEM